jgi:hypothetical protein
VARKCGLSERRKGVESAIASFPDSEAKVKLDISTTTANSSLSNSGFENNFKHNIFSEL